jgi:hypothetical protein
MNIGDSSGRPSAQETPCPAGKQAAPRARSILTKMNPFEINALADLARVQHAWSPAADPL